MYTSASEVVREALRLMEEQDQLRTARRSGISSPTTRPMPPIIGSASSTRSFASSRRSRSWGAPATNGPPGFGTFRLADPLQSPSGVSREPADGVKPDLARPPTTSKATPQTDGAPRNGTEPRGRTESVSGHEKICRPIDRGQLNGDSFVKILAFQATRLQQNRTNSVRSEDRHGATEREW